MHPGGLYELALFGVSLAISCPGGASGAEGAGGLKPALPDWTASLMALPAAARRASARNWSYGFKLLNGGGSQFGCRARNVLGQEMSWVIVSLMDAAPSALAGLLCPKPQ